MEPLKSCSLKTQGLRGGIIIEYCRLIQITLAQTHAAAILQVNGRINDHSFTDASKENVRAAPDLPPDSSPGEIVCRRCCHGRPRPEAIHRNPSSQEYAPDPSV